MMEQMVKGNFGSCAFFRGHRVALVSMIVSFNEMQQFGQTGYGYDGVGRHGCAGTTVLYLLQPTIALIANAIVPVA